MDDRKDISSGNSIDFDESTKRYDHISGGQNIQNTLMDACKDDYPQIIVDGISPLITLLRLVSIYHIFLVALRLTRETFSNFGNRNFTQSQ